MRVTNAIDELGRSGRSPSVAEIGAQSGQSSEDVLEAMEAAQAYQARPIEPPNADGDEDQGDHLSELGRHDSGYDLAELGAAVSPTVASWPRREREILRLRFLEDLTQSQIAERVGISQMHVSRLIRAAVDKLHHAVDEDAVSGEVRR